jgi:hypothetical protein
MHGSLIETGNERPFLFEKKNQKTIATWRTGPGWRVRRTSPDERPVDTPETIINLSSLHPTAGPCS